jgi:LuxR family maltose regulon positive regulatory protein
MRYSSQPSGLPPIPREHFVRERSRRSCRLVLVQGPAGAGKTTAVRGWLHGVPGPVAWLEAGDGQVDSLLTALIAALRQAALPVAADLAALALTDGTDATALVETVLTGLAEAEPHTLVVDDAHRLDGMPALVLLHTLIERLPESTRLVLTGRWEPEGLGLAAWRQGGRLDEAGAADLTFSASETASLIAALTGTPATPAAVADLIGRTGGWAAGMVLALQARPVDPAAGEQPVLSAESDLDAAMRAIVAAQAPDLRRFMLKASLLPNLDETLCREALQEPQAADLLAEWVRRNLFLQADGSGTLVLHDLLRRSLQGMAVSEVPVAERQAITEHLAGHRHPAGMGRSWQQLVGAGLARLSPTLAFGVLVHGDSIGLTTLLAAVPATAAAEPWWQLLQAEAARRQGDFARAEALASRLLSAADLSLRGMGMTMLGAVAFGRGETAAADWCEQALAVLPPDADWARAQTHLVRGCHRLSRSDFAATVPDLQAALDGFRRAGDALGTCKVLLNLGIVHTYLGCLPQAEDAFEAALGGIRAAGRTPPVSAYAQQAAAAVARGQWPRAMALLDEGLSLAQAVPAGRDAAELHLARAAVLIEVGDWTQAEQDLAATAAWVATTGDAYLDQRLALWRIEWWRRQGELVQAQACCEATDALFAEATAPALRLPLRLSRAQLAADSGRLAEAEGLLDALVTDCQQGGFRWWLAQALCLQVQVRQHLSGPAGTADLIREYRRLCRETGFADLLAEAGAPPGSQPASPMLSVRCFGTTSMLVSTDDGQKALPLGHRTRMLMALLLIEPQGFDQGALTERLYDDQAEGASRSALSVLISRLRKAVDAALPVWSGGGIVLWRDGLYRLNPALRLDCDWSDFRAAWREAQTAPDAARREAAYRRMVHLYRGPLFTDLGSLPWLLLAREQAWRQWQEAYSWLQAEAFARGQPSEALDLADTNLAVDPVSEPAHAFKLRALVTLGLGDAARRHYEAMARLWQDEFGMPPPGELATLVSEQEPDQPSGDAP